jgi:hypothetical protein
VHQCVLYNKYIVGYTLGNHFIREDDSARLECWLLCIAAADTAAIGHSFKERNKDSNGLTKKHNQHDAYLCPALLCV